MRRIHLFTREPTNAGDYDKDDHVEADSALVVVQEADAVCLRGHTIYTAQLVHAEVRGQLLYYVLRCDRLEGKANYTIILIFYNQIH